MTVVAMSSLFFDDSKKIRGPSHAKEIVVSLSRPSKMPCMGYSISALRCKEGQRLHKIQGSVCSRCYGLRQGGGKKGNGSWYLKPHVLSVHEKRLRAIYNPLWHWAMIYLINRYQMEYFRWHDVGDLQSVVHLAKIAFIASRTRRTLHWLPTREYEMVYKFWEFQGGYPLRELFPNLIIRLSGKMIDQDAPYQLARKIGVTVSEVRTKNHSCQAQSREKISPNGQKKIIHGFCGDCRNCWNQDLFNISYLLH